ncbi:amidase [Ectobacillus sp. sgz5001026]|uniref:amidase n=1 Tax=Ectobacillus sp. sgz5001026 TaxID=3242473 RepID=UPI0036D397A8
MNNQFSAFIDPEFHLEATGKGKLNGLSFAVKDVFALKGHTNAAGNPDWLRTHHVAEQNAAVVDTLLQYGAQLTGITHTDELMYSLNGENIHYGTPINPNAPGCIPGGSSSGSAVAVASGSVDFALGTDTGGSVRIPSSYNGIYGIRPSHGKIDMEGVIPLSAQFDTVGFMAKDANLLYEIGATLFGEDCSLPTIERIYIAEDAWNLAEESTKQVLLEPIQLLTKGLITEHVEIAPEGFKKWMTAFRLLQGREIWKTHGDWITTHTPTFGPDIADRFEWASHIPEDDAYEKAKQLRPIIQKRLGKLLGETGCLVIPTTPGPAPQIGRSMDAIEITRTNTMQLSCIAGLSGFPQITIPYIGIDHLPIGLSIIGGYGSDMQLLTFVKNMFGSQRLPNHVTK